MQWMEIAPKDTRYIYPTGRIRGLEKYLFKGTDYMRIREGKSLEESFQILLRFYPYSDSMKVCESAGDFERGLEEEWKRTYFELRSFAPEKELVDVFWLDQDFHNIKVLFKIKTGQMDMSLADIYLSATGTTDPNLLKDAVFKEDFFNLSEFFKELMREVHVLVKKKSSSREIDIFLDKRYYQYLFNLLTSFDDTFLRELVEKIIDIYNIETCLRIKLWNREDAREIITQSVVEGGGISTVELTSIAEGPVESLLDCLKGTGYAAFLQKILEEWKEEGSLFKIEDMKKNVLLDFTHRGFYVTYGREPLINYIWQKKWEINNLRAILRAKKAALSLEEMEKMGV